MKLKRKGLNHNEQRADRTQSPNFHAEVNESFQNEGHDTMPIFSCLSFYNDMC